MAEQKVIPENCWVCDKSTDCYASYGEGTCKYKFAIEERERKGVEPNGK